MAIEPTAVTIHDNSEIAPTWAMLVGSMMIPEPIMLTATMNVSWTKFIRFACCCSAMMLLLRSGPRSRSLADHVGAEFDAAVRPLLKHALDLIVEAREAVERLLKCKEIIQHRLCAVVPA